MGIVPDDLPTSSRAQHGTGRKGPQAAGDSTTTRAPINTRLCQPLSKRYAKRLALLVAHRARVTPALDHPEFVVGHRICVQVACAGFLLVSELRSGAGLRMKSTSFSDPRR